MTRWPALTELVSRSRLVRGIGANVYAQAIIAILQLVSVPIFSHGWGLSRYGVWLMLFTVPSYLSLADFGFATAAGNDMTMAYARDDRASARRTLHSTFALVGLSSLSLFMLVSVCVRVFGGINWPHLDQQLGSDFVWTLTGLLAYGVISLFSGIVVAGFRCVGAYATGTTLQATVIAVENGAAICCVFLGYAPVVVAFVYAGCRALGILLSAQILRTRAPWMFDAGWCASLEEIKRIAHPAIAVMAVPVAQSIFLQGTVLVVGAALGNASVPVFTAVRTLSRLGIQLTTIVNHAIMPEFSMAFARENMTRQRELAIMNMSATLAVLAPLFLIVVGFGPRIVEIWTHGAIDPPEALIIPMALTMLLNGTWWPWANLVLSLNRHSQYSYAYLGLSIASVIAAYPLAKMFGTPGAAFSLVALDLVMLVIVWRRTKRLGLVVFPATSEIYQFWRTRSSLLMKKVLH